VPVTDAGVDTVAFLDACEGLVGLFGMSIPSILSNTVANYPSDL